jgi:hypothetical protein
MSGSSNIKLGGANNAFSFASATSIKLADSSSTLKNVKGIYYAKTSSVSDLVTMWSSSSVDPKPIQRVWYDKDTIAGIAQGMIFAKITPSVNIKLTKITKQVNSYPTYFSNTYVAILQLTESNGLYNVASYKFKKSAYSGLALVNTGSIISSKESYDLSCTFTSEDVSANNTLLTAGITYGICMGDIYATYNLLSGDSGCIGSMYGYQLQGEILVTGMSDFEYKLSGTIEYTEA